MTFVKEKICICYSSLLDKCTNVLTENFLRGYVALRHQLNEETVLFIFWRILAVKEVNGENILDGFLELIMYLEVGICHQESHSFNMSLSSPTPQKGKQMGYDSARS